jgi:hypothetical protein
MVVRARAAKNMEDTSMVAGRRRLWKYGGNLLNFCGRQSRYCVRFRFKRRSPERRLGYCGLCVCPDFFSIESAVGIWYCRGETGASEFSIIRGIHEILDVGMCFIFGWLC